MNVDVMKCTPQQWAAYSEDAHKAVFGETRTSDFDRIDYALIAYHGQRIIGFTTCRETDRDSLYWQYGGCFDGNRGVPAVRAFEAVFGYSREKYKRISTLVKNDNVNYLHMLMKYGFRAIGLRNFANDILLEMFWGEQ